MHRICGILLEFLPELQNLIVYSSCGWIRVITPHFIEQLFAAQNTLWIIKEETQKFELVRRQDYLLPALRRLHPREIYLDITESYQRL